MLLTTLAILLAAFASAAQPTAQHTIPVSVPLVPRFLRAGTVISEPCPHTVSRDPKRYMIAWNDTPAIDGDFIFVVHPTQLFLRSGHNNPNPNYVYWVEQLSDTQYKMLVTVLDDYNGPSFRRNRSDRWPGYTLYTLVNPRISLQPPDPLTPEREAAWQANSHAAINANLRRILRELNRGLPQDAKLRVGAAINSYPDVVQIAE